VAQLLETLLLLEVVVGVQPILETKKVALEEVVAVAGK